MSCQSNNCGTGASTGTGTNYIIIIVLYILLAIILGGNNLPFSFIYKNTHKLFTFGGPSGKMMV